MAFFGFIERLDNATLRIIRCATVNFHKVVLIDKHKELVLLLL